MLRDCAQLVPWKSLLGEGTGVGMAAHFLAASQCSDFGVLRGAKALGTSTFGLRGSCGENGKFLRYCDACQAGA